LGSLGHAKISRSPVLPPKPEWLPAVNHGFSDVSLAQNGTSRLADNVDIDGAICGTREKGVAIRAPSQ